VRLKKEDAPRLAALAALWGAFFVVVDPLGRFPLNDDFQYAECARHLLAGSFKPPEWALSSTLTHAFLGALATAPWQAGNQALRMWMLLLGLLGAGGVYLLARRWKAGPDAALLAAATLALSPLYATMSASFHLDVTAAVLTLAALGAFLKGREKGDLRWLLGAGLLIAAAGLTRQTCYLSALGAAVALRKDKKLSFRAGAAVLLPAALAGFGYWGWLNFVHGPTWAWASGAYSPRAGYWLSLGAWLHMGIRASEVLQTTALCLAPLAVMSAMDGDLFRKAGAEESAALLSAGALALDGWYRAGGLPLLQNTLNHDGLGVAVLLGAQDKVSGWWSSPLVWHAAALVALLSSLALVRRAFALKGALRSEIASAGLFVGAPFAAMLLMPALYDRYLTAVLPFAAAALAAGSKTEAKRLAPAFLALAVLAGFTGAGLSDYFAWNRARWDAAALVVSRGAPPDRVEAGFDWDGEFSLTRNLEMLRAKLPDRKIGVWDWQLANRPIAAVSFSKTPPFPGWVLLQEFPYRSPLAPEGAAVRLFADSALVRRR
jgi:hypothetical protein